MGEGKANHPAQDNRSPQGGSKDTNDLSNIKGVQDQGMHDKSKHVQDLPEKVVGTDTPKYPQKR